MVFDYPHASTFGPDLGVFSLSYASHVLWHLGYPAAALVRSREARTWAEALAHPFSQAIALDDAAMLYQFCGDAPAARAHAAAVALCEEHGFAYYRAWGTIIRGWARSEQDHPTEGRAIMQQGLDDLRATGARLRRPYHLTLEKGGDIESGLAFLDEALTVAHTYGERWQEARALLEETHEGITKTGAA